MIELISILNKRRTIAIYVVVLSAIIAYIVSLNFSIPVPNYFAGVYNMYVVLFLIVYKLIELPIIYYFLFHRYIQPLQQNRFSKEKFPKFEKHTKLLFFLIPQGNIIFGIIAYKFSGEVMYFFIFTIIALSSLINVKPNILNTYNNP